MALLLVLYQFSQVIQEVIEANQIPTGMTETESIEDPTPRDDSGERPVLADIKQQVGELWGWGMGGHARMLVRCAGLLVQQPRWQTGLGP